MAVCLALALLLWAPAPVAAGPVGDAAAHAAPATGFPGAFGGSVGLSLSDDALFGSRLLDSLEMQLRTIAAMTSVHAVSDHLEVTALGAIGVRGAAARLRAGLGSEPLDPNKASALLIANALARPEQFRETLDALEARKAGLGKNAARLFAEAPLRGVKPLMAALRAAGAGAKAPGTPLLYDARGGIAAVFDGSVADPRDRAELSAPVSVPDSYDAYGPDGRPRRSGLAPAPRLR